MSGEPAPESGRRVRFPLFLKILAWFFLNVLSLLAIVYFVLGARVGPGLEGLLEGVAGERLRAVTNIVGRDLRAAPQAEWDAVLEKFSESYDVAFAIFSDQARQLAGEPLDLPEEVRDNFFRPRKRGRPEQPKLRPADGASFIERAGDPKAYWVTIPIRLRAPVGPGGTGPGIRRGGGRIGVVILVLRSETLSGNGLLIDVRPWLWTGAGALVFSVLFWLPLVGGITRSISQMTTATGRIASGEFDVAVNERRSDELGRLGGSINRMAERLQGFVSSQRRFMGDIAHELCTPIARTKMALGALEVRTPEEHRAYIRDVDEEMEQMSAMVSELLSFSKASLAREETVLESVPLAPLLETVITRESQGLAVEVSIPEGIAVLAEPGLLSRAIANILRNSVRYAGSAGPVRISAQSDGGTVVLTVTDSGPGVPPETLPQIFDPFFRPEAARTRETGGTGLGLAIVKTCVEACQGRVTARNVSPTGFEVQITLGAATQSD